MLGLCGMRSTPSLPLLPGPLWPGMVSPNKGACGVVVMEVPVVLSLSS